MKRLSGIPVALAALVLFSALPALAAPKTGKAQVKAASHSAAMDQIVANYVRIQEALSADQLDQARAPALAIAQLGAHSGASGAQAAKQAGRLAAAGSLKDAREIFQHLSKPVALYVGKTKPADLEVYYCPMVKARWVQKKGEISNPFLGKEMLMCGEKESP
jgi:hypothetical protein